MVSFKKRTFKLKVRRLSDIVNPSDTQRSAAFDPGLHFVYRPVRLNS